MLLDDDDDREVPLVVTAERAAYWLRVPPERVATLVATVEPWGQNAGGEPVWRLTDLQRRLGRAIPQLRARKQPWWGRGRRNAR
jgi:hypothetical protein